MCCIVGCQPSFFLIGQRMAVAEIEKSFSEERHFSAFFWACQTLQRFLSKRIYKLRLSVRHCFWTEQHERRKDILTDVFFCTKCMNFLFFRNTIFLFIKSIFVSCIAFDRKVLLNTQSAFRQEKFFFLQILLLSIQFLDLHFSINKYIYMAWIWTFSECIVNRNINLI